MTTTIKVISAFPGTGKSYCYEKYKDKIKVYDSDSSLFSWKEPGVRNENFPNNYIEHIKEIYDEADLIFVSSHAVVRKALEEAGIHFMVIYPDKQDRYIYLDRYTKRGNHKDFIEMMEDKFEEFIDGIEEDYNKFEYMSICKITGDRYIEHIIDSIAAFAGIDEPGIIGINKDINNDVKEFTTIDECLNAICGVADNISYNYNEKISANRLDLIVEKMKEILNKTQGGNENEWI